jgi:hypothetical protein
LGDDDVRREEIRRLLAGGLKTEAFPRRLISKTTIGAAAPVARTASLPGE